MHNLKTRKKSLVFSVKVGGTQESSEPQGHTFKTR